MSTYCTLPDNVEFICTCFKNSQNREALPSYFGCFAASTNEFDIFRQCTCIVFILQLNFIRGKVVKFTQKIWNHDFRYHLYNADASKNLKTGYLYPDFGVAHNAYGYQEIYMYSRRIKADVYLFMNRKCTDLAVSKVRKNKFDIFWQCTLLYINYVTFHRMSM